MHAKPGHIFSPSALSMATQAVAEIDATFKKLQSNTGVLGVIVLNNDGVPIRSTFDASKTTLFAGELTPLCMKTKSAMKNLDAEVSHSTAMRQNPPRMPCPARTTLLTVAHSSPDQLHASQDELRFMRLRTKKYEIMIAPGACSAKRYAGGRAEYRVTVRGSARPPACLAHRSLLVRV